MIPCKEKIGNSFLPLSSLHRDKRLYFQANPWILSKSKTVCQRNLKVLRRSGKGKRVCPFAAFFRDSKPNQMIFRFVLPLYVLSSIYG